MYDGVSFVLIVDDILTPTFLPRVLFEVTDTQIPDDWIGNLFADGPVQLVLGPAFLAKDAVSYNAMVDQEMAQMQNFWSRIDARTR